MHNAHALNPISRAKRGFTLVELLVVIAIIALLVALLLPALAGARRAGKKSATQNMMQAFTNAVSSFSNDNGSRMPGYFSQAQMGANANVFNGMQGGMSAMENVMLELGGPDVIVGNYRDFGSQVNRSAGDTEGGIISIAPFDNSMDNAVVVNTQVIGANGAYFAPDAQFLKTMIVSEGQQNTVETNGQHLMPDVVDAFGNPMLVWVKDDSARGSIDPDDPNTDPYFQFAQVTSDDGPAWFYLASNDCFYGDDATSIGLSGSNQRALSGFSAYEQDGTMVVSDEDRVKTLATFLASPSYYALPAGSVLDENTDAHDIFPNRPRGSLIVQSAGADGIYLGVEDAGWRANAHTGSGEYHIDFGNNYVKQTGGRHIDEAGKFITEDISGEFDDIVQSVN